MHGKFKKKLTHLKIAKKEFAEATWLCIAKAILTIRQTIQKVLSYKIEHEFVFELPYISLNTIDA